jgi:hypothetical protein
MKIVGRVISIGRVCYNCFDENRMCYNCFDENRTCDLNWWFRGNIRRLGIGVCYKKRKSMKIVGRVISIGGLGGR